jgi:hypothetical protein
VQDLTLWIFEVLTVYKIAYSTVDERPESSLILMKRMVGASGFEPPTSWSRTRRSSQAEPRPEVKAQIEGFPALMKTG